MGGEMTNEQHACEPEHDCPVRSGQDCAECDEAECGHVMCEDDATR